MGISYDVKNIAVEYLIQHHDRTTVGDDNHHYLEMIAQAGGEAAVKYLISLHEALPNHEDNIAQRFMLLRFISLAANNS